jgi:tryptophanyl-tRNA synthetase
VLAELQPIRERAEHYLRDPTLVRNIIADGVEQAQKLAHETLREVRQVMGLDYSR